MTIPDEIVLAGAEATCRGHGVAHGESCGLCKINARTALQSAFAKLPKCETAVRVVAGELRADHFAQEEAREILAALAREFGGQE